MKRLLSSFFLCLAALPILAYVRDPAPPWASGVVQMQLHLGTQPFYSDGTTPNETAAEAAKVWNQYMQRVQLSSVAEPSSDVVEHNRINEVAFRKDIYGDAFDTGTLAVTMTYYTATTRLEADILVNSNYTWESFRGLLSGRYDLRRVLAHEFGHVLGLTHPDQNGQVVTALMNSRISNLVETPQQDDQDGVASMYGSGTSNPAQAPVLAPNTPADLVLDAGLTATFYVSVASGSAPFSFQWYKNGAAIPGATAASYSLSSVRSTDQGSYRVTVSNAAGSVQSREALLTVVGPDPVEPPSTLLGLATRAYVGTGNDVLIPAFILGGSAKKTILIRAVGPTLAASGVSGSLQDPVIELHKVGVEGVVASNDNWSEAPNLSALKDTLMSFYGELLPDGSKDAAMLVTLDPGAYTIVTSGVGGTTGVALVEVYDTNPEISESRLTALAVRCRTESGDKVPIVGIGIVGSRAKQMIIQGIGPTLGAAVPGFAPNPKLRLVGAAGTIAENNDWNNAPAIVEAAARAGASKLDESSKDAALVATLNPGGYSAVIEDETGAAGIALIEAYEIPDN